MHVFLYVSNKAEIEATYTHKYTRLNGTDRRCHPRTIDGLTILGYTRGMDTKGLINIYIQHAFAHFSGIRAKA